MKNQFLLPAKFRLIGWITFLLFFALGILTESYGYDIPGFQIYYPKEGSFAGYNLTNELAFLGTIIGLLMISFARHINEDELISKIRLESWKWAVLINYAILLILNFTSYGLGFVFIVTYNVLTLLLVYIIRFYYSLYLLNRNLKNSED
ncbi:hypothetical protein [Pedobacter steynii]